jgi:hypothetical protein
MRLENSCEANKKNNRQMGIKRNNSRIQYRHPILHIHRRRLFGQEVAVCEPSQMHFVAAKAIVALPRVRGRASLSPFGDTASVRMESRP